MNSSLPRIVLISASVRNGRKSDRVATYFKNYIEQSGVANAELLDLLAYNFPVFEERLKFQQNPLPAAVEFAEKVRTADGVLIITPEYNGGYPAALKNAIDLLVEEWKKKPVAISTVSAGAFGGMQVITSLQYSFWKIGALTVPALFPVPKVHEAFDEHGVPADKAGTDKRAGAFINELVWMMEAVRRMKN